jgi:hypothetical protein
MTWETQYKASEVPTGVLVIVKKTAVADDTSIGITPSHKLRWLEIKNTGNVELLLANSEAALAAGVAYPLLPGEPIMLTDNEASRRYVVGAPSGGGNGEVAAIGSESRQPMRAAFPELTIDNGFTAYDGSDSDNIVPGV